MTTGRTTEPSDDALRALFAGLRERDLATVPAFDALLARPKSPERRQRSVPVAALAGVGACAVALLAASLWLWPASQRAMPDEVSPALPGWNTPTDSLLADGALQPPWAALPTAALGQPSPHRSLETP